MPVFISDPLKRHYNRDTIITRQKKDIPVIGFCGQAKGMPLNTQRMYSGLHTETPCSTLANHIMTLSHFIHLPYYAQGFLKQFEKDDHEYRRIILKGKNIGLGLKLKKNVNEPPWSSTKIW